MFRVLVLEDDSYKCERLSALVKEHIMGAEISSVSDVSSAVRLIASQVFDLVLLDMALPSHPVVSGGGAPMSLLTGGLEILFELSSLGRKDECIVITQFPEIEIAGIFYSVANAAMAIRSELSCQVSACIQYSQESDDWAEQLKNLLGRYENTNS